MKVRVYHTATTKKKKKKRRKGTIKAYLNFDEMIQKAFYSVKLSQIPNGAKVFSKSFKLDNITPLSAYKTITNIDLYHKYIPYCTDSKILSVSPITKMPTQGSLNVDFQKYSIFFTCDVICRETELLKECIANIKEEESSSKPLFEYLSTKWIIKDAKGNDLTTNNNVLATKAFKGIDINLNDELASLKNTNPGCDINLELTFKFNSYLYQTISVIFGDAVLDLIIKAFKKKMIEMDRFSGQ